MPGSATTPGRPGTRAHAPVRIAFHLRNSVGTRDMNLCEAQWLAYVLPCRRFAVALTDDSARLGADAVRYSLIVSDLHRSLVAGLPAHCERFWTLPEGPRENAAQPRMLGRIAKHREFAERPQRGRFLLADLRRCAATRAPYRPHRGAEGFSFKAFRKKGITSPPAENCREGCCENQINTLRGDCPNKIIAAVKRGTKR